MPIRLPITTAAAALLIALAAPATAGAAPIVPGHVIVRYAPGATHRDRVHAEEATGTGHAIPLPGGTRQLQIKDGDSVTRTLRELRTQPDVAEAHPVYKIQAAGGYYPNDPGFGGLGDWRDTQWNFSGSYGVRVPKAWARMRSLGRPGGRGVVVAVVDSGVAYRDYGTQFTRAPDLYKDHFVPGWDFFDNDPYPLDEDSHGTHVTGTIAEHVNNKKAVTGIAYGVKIMPVRVLGADGNGDTATFARAVKWATDHGADVINMSVEMTTDERAKDIPEVIAALRYAHAHGVVMVGSAGNTAENHISYPARDKDVISVGATTSHGCVAKYSQHGDGLDLVAPGGGDDADLTTDSWDRAHCHPGRSGRQVYQQTFTSSPRSFHLVGYEGTSEAAPHVTAIAALVIASGVIGSHPSPEAVQQRLEDTARDLGPGGYDKRYGYGLVDATAAVGG